jgi:hypothetical protein
MSTTALVPGTPSVPAPQSFDELADLALQAMRKLAVELNIKGVALVAYAPGETVTTWSSKMMVMGMMIRPASATKNAGNLLAIAYSKAAEMADTLNHSGSAGRPPILGEHGFGGGRVARGKTGILLAAFSGGPSEDDAKVSQAGLDVFAGRL